MCESVRSTAPTGLVATSCMSCAGRAVSEILAAGRGVYISQYNRCREAKRIDGEIVGTTIPYYWTYHHSGAGLYHNSNHGDGLDACDARDLSVCRCRQVRYVKPF